jgi:hypothetical protein
MAKYPYRQFATEETKMTTHQHRVSYGYLSDFKGDSVVLFLGDRVALENFAEFLEALSITHLSPIFFGVPKISTY